MKTTSLTLTRREGEAIIIDHDIRVIIKEAKSGRVRVTINAPDDVDVIREELEGVWPVEDDIE